MTIKNYELYLAAKPEEECVILASPKQTSDNASAGFGQNGNYAYLHSFFVADADRTIRTVVLMLSQVGTSVGTIKVSLCTSSGEPNWNPVDVVDADSLIPANTPYAHYYARFSSGYPITNGQTYHIRLYTTNNNVSNYPIWRYNNNVAAVQLEYSLDGSTWNPYDTTAQGYFELSECVTYTHT